MRVLAVEPMRRPYMTEIDEGLEALQKAVGGSIEAVYPFEDEVAVVCNEEGKINGLPLNRALYDDEHNMYDILAGRFLVVGLGREDFTSLTKEQEDKFYKLFEKPERFMRMGHEIIAVPFDIKRSKEQYEPER